MERPEGDGGTDLFVPSVLGKAGRFCYRVPGILSEKIKKTEEEVLDGLERENDANAPKSA